MKGEGKQGLMDEVWRPIKGFPYDISNMGQVRRSQGASLPMGRPLHPANFLGYPAVGLWKDGKEHLKQIHRLVLEAFVGPCPPNHQSNHINGRKDDNRVENLEWVTEHTLVAHLSQPSLEDRGYLTKIQDWQTTAIRALYATGDWTQGELAGVFRVHQSLISDIINRKAWKHLSRRLDLALFQGMVRQNES